MPQDNINNIPNPKRAQVYAMFDGCCAYCGRRITFRELDIDHIWPKSRGGGNELQNLFPSCQRCNRLKDNRTIEEFRKEIASQVNSLQDHIVVDFGLATLHRNKKVEFLFEKHPSGQNILQK